MPLSFTSHAITPAQGFEDDWKASPVTAGNIVRVVGGNLYYVTSAQFGVAESTFTMWIQKSTDNGTTWTVVFNGDHPGFGQVLTSAVVAIGTTLYIAVAYNKSSVNETLLLKFSTLTDTFLTDPADNGFDRSAGVGLATFSDGSLLLCTGADIFPGFPEQPGVYLAHYDPGTNTWTGPVTVDAVNFPGPLIAENSSNRAYLFIRKANNSAVSCLTVTNPMTLGTPQNTPIAPIASGTYLGIPCIRGSNTEVILPYRYSTTQIHVIRAACSATPTFTDETVDSGSTLPVNYVFKTLQAFEWTPVSSLEINSVLYVFYVVENGKQFSDKANSAGFLYYSSNTGPTLGWAASITAYAPAVPSVMLTPYPTSLGVLIGYSNPLLFYSSVTKYASLGTTFLALGSPMEVLCGSPPDGEVGVPYMHTFPVTGGTPPYTFAITAGALPTGLTLNTATGTVSGIPTAAGTFAFTVQVTDSAALTDDVACSITIIAGPSVTGNPPPGTVGGFYNYQLTISGGTGTYTVVSNPPPGLTIDDVGLISGVPTQSGSFTVTVTVTDSAGGTGGGVFSIVINPANPCPDGGGSQIGPG